MSIGISPYKDGNSSEGYEKSNELGAVEFQNIVGDEVSEKTGIKNEKRTEYYK